MKELQKESLLTTIIKSIAAHISDNQLGPGDKLPNEIEIARRLNVARTSVRESLKALQAIGILESKAGVGTTISKRGLDPFVLSLVLGSLIGTTSFRQLGEIRIIMEQGAVPLIIQRAEKDALEGLLKLAEELDNLKEKFNAKPDAADNLMIAEKEITFHQSLLGLSQNTIIEKFGFLLRLFFYQASAQGELFIQTQRISIPQGERVMHRDIVKALLARDIEAAEEKVRMHLRYWAECKDELDPAYIYKIILPELKLSLNKA